MLQKTTKSARGRPKKVLMSDAHRDELMAGVDLIVTSIQDAEERGHYNGYYDGLLKGYSAGVAAAQALHLREDKEDDFSFWGTLFATIGIGSIVIGLWWILSGQL